MKPLLKFSIALLVVAVTFSACNDDDEKASPLIGSWRFTSEAVTECSDPDDNDSDTCTSNCDVVVFTATTITADGDVLNYTRNGNQITISEAFGGVTITYTLTYVVSGSTLTLTSKDSADLGSCKTVSTYTKI